MEKQTKICEDLRQSPWVHSLGQFSNFHIVKHTGKS